MQLVPRLTTWLETRWLNPAYSGWLLGVLGIFFFAAATNTMAGWLYVMSGIDLALLAIAAILSRQNLKGLQIVRRPVPRVSAGDELTVSVRIQNASSRRKSLVQVEDMIPSVLGSPVRHVVEAIQPNEVYEWVYRHSVEQRGVYRWQAVEMRTAAPLGLFWCRQREEKDAIAVVYPQVLPLNRCPLIDQIGQDTSFQFSENQRTQSATEGMTRSLRPYRWGDPMRLIHWRSSARYGDLRVRELEIFTSGQEIVVGLDSAIAWESEAFEEAVIAAASLYFYAKRQNLKIRLWTAGSGLIQGEKDVLETLAAIDFNEEPASLPQLPMVWLTQNSASLGALPAGSRWVCWGAERAKSQAPGLGIEKERSFGAWRSQSLQVQLQEMPKSF